MIPLFREFPHEREYQHHERALFEPQNKFSSLGTFLGKPFAIDKDKV